MSNITNLTNVPFRGGSIAVTADQQVALKPVCEAMGLDHSAQRKRLQRTPWAVGAMTATTGADGKTYEMYTIDRRTFTMWLATIETSRVQNPDVAERVAIFQREAADALDHYFHDGGAINPRATEHQINALIFQSRARMELLHAAKGLIHPDHLEARARVVLAAGLGEHAELNPDTRPLYAQDYLGEKNLSKARLRAIAGVFGKRAKAAYIERHGRPPQRYPLNLGNGQTREVNAYTEADRPLLDHVWTTYYQEKLA